MKEIPNTKGYYADKEGRIYNPDKLECEYYTNGDGYITVMVMTLEDKFTTTGVHRLILRTYRGEPEEGQHGNHIDGDITNNALTNVEWVTPAENNVHATLLNRFTKRPLIIITKDSEVDFLNDLHHAAEHFGTELGLVWDAIKTGSLLKGWKVEHLKSSDKRVQQLRRHELEQKTYRREISCMDLFTGEVQEFPTMLAVSKHFKCRQQTISQCISTSEFPKLFQKHYVLIEKTNNFEFLTEGLKKKLLARAPKKVIAAKQGGLIILFKSAYEFRTMNGLSKKIVTTTLKKNVSRELDGWKFFYRETISKEQRKELEDWARSPIS